MSVASDVRPMWTDSPSAHAVWVSSGESPEWIAARTDALLRFLRAAFDTSEWSVGSDGHWEGPPEALADLVRRHPVRELISAEEVGDTLPGEGYSFTVSGAGPGVALRVHVAAGNSAVGTRLPRRRLNIELREMYVGALTGAVGDAVCDAVVQAWRPSTVVLSDDLVRRPARRGNW